MKKIILTCLTAFSLLLTKNAFAQYTITIPPFGINGWMGSFVGDGTNVYNCNGLSATYSTSPSQKGCYLDGKADAIMTGTCSAVVKDLHINLIRYGGISNDINFPTYDQFINEIDRIRALGAEPIIQIPYYEKYTATDASNLLTYLNVTRGKKIKYVEIGNEPDNYPGYSGASKIAIYFKSIATALKAVNNNADNIQIIGPSFADYPSHASDYATLLGPATNSNSIAGMDGAGHYYLDIVDIHRYPFDGNQIRSQVIDDPANSTGTYTATCFASSCLTNTTSTGLLDYISLANVNRPSNKLQFSVSEMNVNWQNPSVNTYTAMGTAGFIAGQWMADMYSVILDKAGSKGVDLSFIAPWSLQEGGSTYDYGVLDAAYTCTTTTTGKRSTYEHLAMMGQYFKGIFYKGTNNGIGNVKQFGTYLSGGYYAIMIINEDASNYYTYTVNTYTGTSSTALNINMGISGTNHFHSYTSGSPGGIPPKSTHLLFFDCSGNWKQTLNYDETLAGSYGAPTYLEGTSTWFPISLTMSSSNTGCTTYTNTGSATVTATGGTGSYTYTWSPSGYTGGNTATYSNLPAGTYTVSVGSGTVCTAAQTAIVTIAPASPSVTITSPLHANSCSYTVAFTATATAGTSPYTYSWSGGGGTGSTSTTYTQSGAQNSANEYTVTVTDAHGCINTALCTHYQTNSVTVTGTPTANTCCSITLTATYIAGAVYSWTRNGFLLSPSLYPSAATHILTGPLGSGTFVATAANGQLNPCTSASGTFVVTTAGHTCNCPQGPVGKLSNTATVGEAISKGSAIDGLFPNPTSNATTIMYHLNDNVGKAVIVVSDLMGREKERLHLNPNSKQVDLACAEYSEGIYFVTLLTDNQKVSSKKLMIVK